MSSPEPDQATPLQRVLFLRPTLGTLLLFFFPEIPLMLARQLAGLPT